MPHKWDPKVYDKSSSAQKIWAEEVISKIKIKGDERVLDIGCGDGKITAHIASLLPQGSVLGIDSSAEMVRFAQSRFPFSSWPNLSFRYADARDLHLSGEFDLIVSFAALHWVLDHRPVLEGIKRSLKPGGRLMPSRLRLYAAAVGSQKCSELARSWLAEGIPPLAPELAAKVLAEFQGRLQTEATLSDEQNRILGLVARGRTYLQIGLGRTAS